MISYYDNRLENFAFYPSDPLFYKNIIYISLGIYSLRVENLAFSTFIKKLKTHLLELYEH